MTTETDDYRPLGWDPVEVAEKIIAAAPEGWSAKILETENEENNPMFNINVRLGFEREPDWVSYVKTIKPIEKSNGTDS